MVCSSIWLGFVGMLRWTEVDSYIESRIFVYDWFIVTSSLDSVEMDVIGFLY